MGSRNVLKAQRRHVKQERLEARIPAAQKRMLERAASLRGTTLSDFVIASGRSQSTPDRGPELARAHAGNPEVTLCTRSSAPCANLDFALYAFARTTGLTITVIPGTLNQ